MAMRRRSDLGSVAVVDVERLIPGLARNGRLAWVVEQCDFLEACSITIIGLMCMTRAERILTEFNCFVRHGSR